MKLISILILATLLTAQKYVITIDIEVESLQKAGEVEKVILDKLKEYKPAIGIKTRVDVQRLFYGQTLDSLKSERDIGKSFRGDGTIIEVDTLYRGKNSNEIWSK